MPRHTVTLQWQSQGGGAISRAFDVTAGEELNLEQAITAASGDPESPTPVYTTLNVALNPAKVKLLLLLCDGDVVVKTNSTGSPDNIFTLAAGVPFVWTQGAGPLTDTTGDAVETVIVTLRILNAIAAARAFILKSLSDPT